MVQSNVVKPQAKCYTLIWLNPKPKVALLCASTNYQMIQSNVVPLYFYFFFKKSSKLITLKLDCPYYEARSNYAVVW